MAADSSHGLVRVAATVATVVETQIGADIQVPVRAGGWMINDISGQVVRQTASPAVSIGGTMRIFAPSGDLTPDPAPAHRPVYESGSLLNTTSGVSACPIWRYPTEINASGLATIELFSTNAIASAVAPIWAVGVHFAPAIVVPQRPLFGEFVRATQSALARTLVGTITLSEKAQKITEIMGIISQDGVLTTAEELIGFFDLASDDIELAPSQWLFNTAFGAGIGATIASGYHSVRNPYLVDIPVVGGARIDCSITLTTAVTNPADVMIYIGYR